MNSWKAFSASCWLWKHFPCKKVVKMLGKVVVGWWEVNKADEEKLLNQVHATFEALVVWCVIGHCCGEKLGSFCWPVVAADIAGFHTNLLSTNLFSTKFSVANLIHLLNIVLRCNGFSGIRKALVHQPGSRPLNSDHDLFWVQDWLWEVLWSFFSV